MRYRFYFFFLLTVTSPCLAREIELVSEDSPPAGRAKDFREEVETTLSGLDTTRWHLRKGRAEALVRVRDTTAMAGWTPIAGVSFEAVPVDTTPAGRWSSIAGTSFLDDGEWPYIDREGNLWWARQREVFVLKQNRLSQMTLDFQARVILQDATGAMWFFGHARDSLIASRCDGATWETTKTKLK